jgi:hypothetical protein
MFRLHFQNQQQVSQFIAEETQIPRALIHIFNQG